MKDDRFFKLFQATGKRISAVVSSMPGMGKVAVWATMAVLGLAGVALLCLPAQAGKDNVFFGRWLSSATGQLAPMPEAREGYCLGFSSAEVDGMEEDRIYVSHGLVPGVGDTADLRAYDIDTDTWISLMPAPTVRSEGVGVAHGGLLYCIGGRNSGVVADMEGYDPTIDTWMTLSPMANARAGLAAAAVGNRIYTFGGNDVGSGPCSGPALDVAEAYDIAIDTWSPITPPPVPVTQATAVAKGGKIYVFGGCSVGPEPLQPGPVQIYDPTSDSWTAGDSMPTGRAALAVGVLGNTMYAIGGWDPMTGNLGVVEAYDRDKDMWSGPLAPKPTPASEVFAASHGGKLFVPGSGSFGISSSVNEAFKKK